MTNPKHSLSAGAVVINEEGKILLLKGPRRGWEFPGGIVEYGEAIQDGVVREVKEETGIDIEVVKFCGIFQNVNKSICNTLFLGKPIGGEPTTSSESLEVGYFPIEEALKMVKWSNFRERIEMILNDEQHPFCIAF